MKRPCFLLGILSLLISFTTLFCNVTLILLTALLILLTFFVIFCVKGKKIFKNSNIWIFLVFVILLVASSVFFVSCVYAPLQSLCGTTADFEGTVIREPEHNGKWTVYTLKGKHSMLKGDLKCTVVTNDNVYNVGDRLNITVTLKPLDAKYKNNGLADGIFLSSYIKTANEIKIGSSPFYQSLGEIRTYIKNQIYSNSVEDTGGVMFALLTGNREFIPDSLYDKTKVCGVTHVMVVSGLHVGILSGILLKFLSKLKIKRKFSVTLCFALFLLLIALCDFHTSAIRSVVMSSVMLLGSLINRKADPLNSLGLAVTVMTLVNPFIAGSPSFLLSVFATFGVVFVYPMLQYLLAPLRMKGKLGRYLNVILDMTIVATSATICILPVSTYYFGYISPLSPLVTVLIGFAVESALILSALGIILSPVPFVSVVADAIIYLANISTGYINSVMNFFGDFDNLIIYIDPKLWFFTFIFSSLLIFAVRLLYNNKKRQERKKNDAA